MLVGLDFSLTGLLEGRRRFHDLCLVAGNGLSLPFADASFDEVIGHVSMPYMNTRAALREVYRVLAPGRTFFLTFHSLAYVRQRLLKSLRRGQWKDVLLMLYTAANGFLNHCGLPQIPWLNGKFETINTAAGVERTARKIGFSTVRIERLPGLIFFGVIGRKPDPQCRETAPDPGWSIATIISDGVPANRHCQLTASDR